MSPLNRNNIKLFLAVAGVVMLVTFLAALFNSYSEYSKAQVQWDKSRSKLTVLNEEIIKINQYIETYEKEKLAFSEYLFDEQDIPAFIDGISKYARQTNVQIVDMKTKQFKRVSVPPGASESQSQLKRNMQMKKQQQKASEQSSVQAKPTLASMPIDIKLEGTYSSLLEFLNYLEGFKQLLSIGDVMISSDKEYPILQSKLSIRIYSLRNIGDLIIQ